MGPRETVELAPDSSSEVVKEFRGPVLASTHFWPIPIQAIRRSGCTLENSVELGDDCRE